LQAQEPVTVAILNYNGRADIAAAIRSVQTSDYCPAEILVVDDGSTDGSVTFIREHFPHIRLVEMGRNTKRLNQVRNCALRAARTRLVFLMDHDVVLAPDCLSVLVAQMRAMPQAAVLTTRALFEHDPGRVYVDAQSMHFLCNSVAFGRDDTALTLADDTPRPSIGWGTQLIDTAKATVVGFFDEHYLMGWGDDGEFHYKLHLVGLGCYSVPRAIVYHKRHTGADRIYGSIRNRWCLIIETYALKTIVLLAPALLLYELALFGFLCLKGQWRAYLHAMWDIVQHLPHLVSHRGHLQKLRATLDKELLVCGPIYIRQHFVDNRLARLGMRVLNSIFTGYWQLAHRFL
jgi:GT2 family glycosyltransferase